MKEKNGFTLIELLGALILVILIAYVTFSLVIERINETNNALDDATLALIYSSTETYIKENINYFPKTEGKIYCIKLQDLIDYGFLNVTLLKKGQKLDSDMKVKVTVNNNQYKDYILLESDDCIAN